MVPVVQGKIHNASWTTVSISPNSSTNSHNLSPFKGFAILSIKYLFIRRSSLLSVSFDRLELRHKYRSHSRYAVSNLIGHVKDSKIPCLNYTCTLLCVFNNLSIIFNVTPFSKLMVPF